MSTTDAVILTHADKKKGRGSLFLSEKKRRKSLLLDNTDSLPKSLENIFSFSGNTISYSRSNTGFLILFAFDCFSFTVYLEVAVTSHQIPAILPPGDNWKPLLTLN